MQGESAYMKSEAKEYLPALEKTAKLIDGFESPYGMELLTTVDWLLYKQECDSTIESVKRGIEHWEAGSQWANRKLALFHDAQLEMAIERLIQH